MVATKTLALVALLACCTGALAQDSELLPVGVTDDGTCKLETFCERWMCQQNFNRKCRIAAYLGIEVCAEATTPEFVAQWAACNATQSGEDLNVVTCEIDGKVEDVGRNYILSTCELEKPPQLVDADRLHVQAESYAVDVVKANKIAAANALYEAEVGNCGTPNFVPTLPCICSETASQATCEKKLRKKVFSKGAIQEQNLIDFADAMAEKMLELGLFSDPALAQASAFEYCVSRYGTGNICSKEVESFTSPVPVPLRRRQ